MDALDKQLTALARAFQVRIEQNLRKVEFGPKQWKLPHPRICVMEAKRSRRVLGWHSHDRWKQGAVKLDEIVLTPAAVSKGIFHAAETLAHEFVHLANAVALRPDTSRQGRYHNELFRETAEAIGLIVKQDKAFGWSDTRLGPKLEELVRRLVSDKKLDSHVFKYQRQSGAVAKTSLVKMTADCGVFAYVTRSRAATVKLQCGTCGAILRIDDN